MSSTEELARALEELAGPTLVLDGSLRIVAFTPGVAALVGYEPSVGVSAPKLLCGHESDRPLAEALVAGRAVVAEILRPDGSGDDRVVRVRANPFARDNGGGWIVSLRLEPELDHEQNLGLVTRDPAMLRLIRATRAVAQSEATVLVRGETGTGKELIARAIHRASKRAAGPFRAINCAAIPRELLESELFGHARGAFTGAVSETRGHFRLAEGGTLFLDEVAELTLDVQAKLLRVLQEKTVIPVGGDTAIEIDVRVISATHRALREEVKHGRFRADLLYRLRVVPLFLPALRERPGDIELLARHFLARRGSGTNVPAPTHITEQALAALRAYPWPGNVRELENVIEYATVMGDGVALALSDLPPEIRGEESSESTAVPETVHVALDENLPDEARRLINAVERAAGHMGRAAATLGISRTTLWRKLKRYGIDTRTLKAPRS